TSIAQIVAEELSLPLEKVVVVTGDTDTAPWSTMSVGSQTLYSLSTAAYRACQDVKAQLGALAARKLGADAAAIEFVDGVFRVKGKTEKVISFADLAKSALAFRGEGPLVGRGSVGGMPAAPTLSVSAADVEVDEETGKVKILSFTEAQDVGLAINPMSVEGQIQGAVTQGIGWALMEGYQFENGVVQNTTFLDYRLPTATDVPMIDTILVEVGSSDGVYGVRHAGEPPMIPTLAAIANAVYRATGVRIKELPMNPEAVLKAIRNRGKA
ncbi:MAG: molybdopterin cofactor-binding domain-containing protein, partial [Chloroflexota bacterium]